MKSEVWKSIFNYEDFYEISSLGVIKSKDRISNNKLRKGKTLKLFLRGNYYAVALSKYGQVKQFSLHRLLGEHFIENPENKFTINHKDGNKINNNLDNLEWATHSEQIIHAIKYLGFIPHKVKCIYTEELKEIRRKARVGYIFSKFTKEKIRKSLNKKVGCITDNIIFDSLYNAAEYSGIPKSTFHRKLHNNELINGKKYEFIK